MSIPPYKKRKQFAQNITALLSKNYRGKNSFPKKLGAPLPKLNALDSLVAVILSQDVSIDRNQRPVECESKNNGSALLPYPIYRSQKAVRIFRFHFVQES